ncbi:hypothetical protein THAOC_15364 [Thalassiosira oceanica]|uniref:Leucine-rich repeat domain-containing protein n=1 Tax=Thalassiosira oceanica TaxID=159749 RepID=K0SF05_THAOC|nr:hypothetical protein THAOC_15364 [Thalassiosira oceanica]|eukprot:EJK63950.1 hypothetical protein THAOC_15364 [Thalassiosira oceanica]
MDNVGKVVYYSGGEIPDELRSRITSIHIGPQVEDIPKETFEGCSNLTDVQFAREGALKVIGACAFEGCTALQQVSIPPSVTELGDGAFSGCSNLTDVQFAHDGVLQVIGNYAFCDCTALQQVSIPPSVTELGDGAFSGCSNLTDVQFAHDGALQVIGIYAFSFCTALQRVSIPPSVTELSWAFSGCSNLIEVILLGEGFLDLDHLGEAALNKTKINKMFGPGLRAFRDCGLTTIKMELSQCMARLPEECRRSVEGEIPDMHSLELSQDGSIFARFPVIRSSLGGMVVQDKNNQTAASLHRLLRLISFHELKESSILTELAVWKSRIDQAATPVPPEERSEYRVSIPDPAKCLIMEYCGFTGFLEPAIEGD